MYTFEVTASDIYLTGYDAALDRLVEGSQLIHEASFAFTGDEWDELTKVVVFSGSSHQIEQTLDDTGIVTIPWEVESKAASEVKAGVYGFSGTKVRPTVWCDVGTVEDGTDSENEEGREPTETAVAQLMEAAKTATDAATAATSATTAANEAADTANTAASNADTATTAANEAASKANTAASKANTAANTALEIANRVAQGSAGDSDVAALREQNATLASKIADLEGAYYVLDEVIYAPASKASMSGTTATVTSTSSISGSTVTLA